MPLIRSAVSPEDGELYTRGMCHAFAVALRCPSAGGSTWC